MALVGINLCHGFGFEFFLDGHHDRIHLKR
jgi:hypothetical protein